MTQLFTNNSRSTLGAPLSAGATTLTLAAGQGTRFPVLSSADYFLLTLADPSSGNETMWEIVKVTSRAGDVLTVERGQELTTVRDWPMAAPVELRLTAGAVQSALAASVPNATPVLKPLLVYYGYPIAYKGIWTVAGVVAELVANFKYWVIGDSYQVPTQEVYASTVQIVTQARAAGVKVYGYVPIGQSTRGLTLVEIKTRIDQWVTVGVDGIFLDEFGYDYGNTRQKQIDCVNHVYGKGLPYTANAWTIEDMTMDNIADAPWPSNDWRYTNTTTYNPANLPLPRGPRDAYIMENFCYSNLGPGDVFLVQERALLTSQKCVAKNIQLWALAVLPEVSGGVLNTALMGNLTQLSDIGAYVSANAYLYDISIVGSGGYTFGAGSIPLWAPLQPLHTSVTQPNALAANNYVTKTGLRSFGGVTGLRSQGGVSLKVTNDVNGQHVQALHTTALTDADAVTTLTLLSNVAPVVPLGNGATLFGKLLAGRMFPAWVGPSGMDTPTQPALWQQKVARWSPIGNSAAAPAMDGFGVPTALGTATARNVATTNLMARTKRLGYVSAATAGALAGHYHPSAQVTTGDGAGLGGFFFSCRFAFSDVATVAGARAFIGMSSSVAAPTNVEPSTLADSIGIGQLSTDTTQLYLFYGGSTAQAAIALGTNFPPMTAAGATSGPLYELTLFASPNANGVVGYRLEKIGTPSFIEGLLTPATVGTQTPASTTLLTPRAWRCNNATALDVGLDIVNMYLETDY